MYLMHVVASKVNFDQHAAVLSSWDQSGMVLYGMISYGMVCMVNCDQHTAVLSSWDQGVPNSATATTYRQSLTIGHASVSLGPVDGVYLLLHNAVNMTITTKCCFWNSMV